MKTNIFFFIVIANFLITNGQKEKNNNKNESSNINDDDKKNDNKSKNIRTFILYISFIIIFIILVYILVKIFVKCFKKKFAFKKLFEGFMDDKLIKEEIIDQVKYVYGFNYIISFLKDIIFISCKFKKKYNELKNCGNCSICLNGFDLNDKIFITACNHVYHNKCMVDYLNLITKEINPTEKEIQNFHNYFKCPNCKEYLFANRNYLEKKKIPEINIDNQNKIDIKNDLIVVSHKSRQNVKSNNIISTESSSIRNLKKKFYKKKKRDKKPIFRNVENIQNNVGNKNEIISSIKSTMDQDNNNIQSNMKLKETFQVQKVNQMKKEKPVENDDISTKNEEINNVK
jgi:hypothetical protein